MKVKTYRNQSLQEGLEDIKRDLGGDALILNTRAVSERPKFGLFKKQAWEITAALEEHGLKPAPTDEVHISRKPPLARQHASAALKAPSPPPAVPATTAAAAAVAPARDERMDELIGEISELKRTFRSLSRAIPPRKEPGAGLYAELLSQGMHAAFADHLISTASRGKPAPTELRERVRKLLGDQLVIAQPAELDANTRIVSVFVGPTGVGKTTTIAKIAGHAALRMKKRVALISTDMFRIGGQEQLIRFGELLGVPTYGCADDSTLNDLISSLDDRELVLIDTPGSSPSDVGRLSKVGSLVEAGAKVHLVVSATTRSEDISKVVSRFQRFTPASVIFTKIDETVSKGSLAGDLLRNELAVSYLTNGQRVPEDLLIPSADELSRYVLPLEPVL
jgi:flagellar biosynthesis protein FlhF